jgi:hypothetical protein
MAEITDYGQLEGCLVADIFGKEMVYNDLIAYTNPFSCVHVVVHRTECIETKRQHVEVYFDDKKVIDEYYSQYHSSDMFYHLTNLEEDDDYFICDECRCLKDKEHYVSVDDDDSGNTICEDCVDQYIEELHKE